MLTIGILFTDKDLEYLPDLITNINNKCWIDFEIILCDNRNDFSSDISFLNEYKIVNLEAGNIYQLAGRKKIIEEASGSYIWFIDADDDIFPVDDSFLDLLSKNYDEYIFSFLIKSADSEDWSQSLENKLLENELLLPEAINTPCCLWNKWIKTEILKEVIKDIPDNIRASASEDMFYSLASLKLSKTQYQSEKFIYTYYCTKSSSAIGDYSNGYEKFERCLFGLKEATALIKSVITEEDFNKLGLDLDYSDAYFFFKKILTTKDKSIKEKMFNKLLEVISEEALIKVWNYFLDSGIDEENFNFLDSLMYEKFGSKICNVITTDFLYDDGTSETKTEIVRKVPSSFVEIATM